MAAIIFLRRTSFYTITVISEFILLIFKIEDTAIMENEAILPLTGFGTALQNLYNEDAQRKLFPATL